MSEHRDRTLADQLLSMVTACGRPRCALVVLTDGWSASPGSIRRACREQVKRAGTRGRCRVQAWPEIVSGTVSKHTATPHVVEVIGRMAHGTVEQAEELLALSAGGITRKTAFIERFHGTMRERLARVTRRSRHASRRLADLEAGMWLVSWTSHGCWPHQELSRRIARAQGRRGDVWISPAMAAGRTDHRLSCARASHVSSRPAALRGSQTARSTDKDGSGAFSTIFRPTSPAPSPAQGGLLPIHRIGTLLANDTASAMGARTMVCGAGMRPT